MDKPKGKPSGECKTPKMPKQPIKNVVSGDKIQHKPKQKY